MIIRPQLDHGDIIYNLTPSRLNNGKNRKYSISGYHLPLVTCHLSLATCPCLALITDYWQGFSSTKLFDGLGLENLSDRE